MDYPTWLLSEWLGGAEGWIQEDQGVLLPVLPGNDDGLSSLENGRMEVKMNHLKTRRNGLCCFSSVRFHSAVSPQVLNKEETAVSIFLLHTQMLHVVHVEAWCCHVCTVSQSGVL